MYKILFRIGACSGLVWTSLTVVVIRYSPATDPNTMWYRSKVEITIYFVTKDVGSVVSFVSALVSSSLRSNHVRISSFFCFNT